MVCGGGGGLFFFNQYLVSIEILFPYGSTFCILAYIIIEFSFLVPCTNRSLPRMDIALRVNTTEKKTERRIRACRINNFIFYLCRNTIHGYLL